MSHQTDQLPGGKTGGSGGSNGGGDGGGVMGGGGGGGRYGRTPQSVQSVPYGQSLYPAPGPPSSQIPSASHRHNASESAHSPGGGDGGGVMGGGGGDGGGSGGEGGGGDGGDGGGGGDDGGAGGGTGEAQSVKPGLVTLESLDQLSVSPGAMTTPFGPAVPEYLVPPISMPSNKPSVLNSVLVTDSATFARTVHCSLFP